METGELNIDVDELYSQLTRVETTIGSNGYPKSLEYAYYCDNRTELKDIIEELEQEGYEITELFLRKRDGQMLWNREYRNHFSIDFEIVNDSDWCMSLDMSDSEERIKEDIDINLIGDDEDYREELGQEEIDRIVNSFYDDVKRYEGDITVFYCPEHENDIDYVITDHCTGYHDGDVTSYQMAFSVELPEEEED